jgi:predicted transport protein
MKLSGDWKRQNKLVQYLRDQLRRNILKLGGSIELAALDRLVDDRLDKSFVILANKVDVDKHVLNEEFVQSCSIF